jgi:hypothetical protein
MGIGESHHYAFRDVLTTDKIPIRSGPAGASRLGPNSVTAMSRSTGRLSTHWGRLEHVGGFGDTHRTGVNEGGIGQGVIASPDADEERAPYDVPFPST